MRATITVTNALEFALLATKYPDTLIVPIISNNGEKREGMYRHARCTGRYLRAMGAFRAWHTIEFRFEHPPKMCHECSMEIIQCP